MQRGGRWQAGTGTKLGTPEQSQCLLVCDRHKICNQEVKKLGWINQERQG